METKLPEKKTVTRPEYLAELERHRIVPDLIKMVTGSGAAENPRS